MARLKEKTFGENATRFFLSLDPDFPLPAGFEYLLPYKSDEVKRITREFFARYYDDSSKRIFILGINPGRNGAGTTGIAFTDPIRLNNDCGIKNELAKKPELSSDFIYRMIHESGGVEYFYRNFFLTAVCPIGFVLNGKNVNYYDDKNLISSSRKFIEETIVEQTGFGYHRQVAICLGEGKNFAYLSALNEKLKLFDEIIPLAHPRFILQYKRKQLREYLGMYVESLKKAVKKCRDS